MQPSSAITKYGDQEFETGLEDFSAEDLRMPRLSIMHKTATFKDSLTGAEYPELHIIAFGLVKQRVMWQPQVDDDSSPLCKSTDYKVGFPTMDAKKANENFPWGAAGWQPTDFPRTEDNRVVLPCENCRLKEWGSHPDGKKTWCTEQHTIPLLYTPDAGAPPQMMALFTTQRSSITASKAFFAGIVRASEPAYSVTAKLTLQKNQRGTNEFCVPIFTITGRSNQDDWPTYSGTYRQIRDFLVQPPRKRDDGVNADLSNNTQPQYQQGFQPQQNWAQAAPAQQVPQQYSPAMQAWSGQQGPPQQAPVQQAPVQQAPAQQAPQQQIQYPSQPLMQSPLMQQQPQQAPQTAQQVVQPTSPLPANPTARDADPDDLPF